MGRIHCYTDVKGKTESGLSLTEVKKRIRKFGGTGFTQHFDRDGSLQETTPVTLGNNARTTYRAEYNTSRCFRKGGGVAVTAETTDRVDVDTVLARVTEQARHENLGESDNDRLLQLLGSELGVHAARASVFWLDWALCRIHGRLYHEFRGLNRYADRTRSIHKFKNKQIENK